MSNIVRTIIIILCIAALFYLVLTLARNVSAEVLVSESLPVASAQAVGTVSPARVFAADLIDAPETPTAAEASAGVASA